ncbi:MAG: ABC transporter ATP-binding protein, partial [Cereibacter sp.]
GTVLLVSHDRDFIDRVATATVALEGQGRATAYPGGWSDYAAQRGVAAAERDARPAAPAPAAPPGPRPEGRRRADPLSFAERNRLETLPAQIARLEGEIARLTTFLSQDGIFLREPEKARRGADLLAERQAALALAEEDWLALEERAGG